MSQSRIVSLIESLCNVASGFVISLAVWIWVIEPVFGIDKPFCDNLVITGIFTVVSIIRSYLWRRTFNHKAQESH